jgi:hypothetical protein
MRETTWTLVGDVLASFLQGKERSGVYKLAALVERRSTKIASCAAIARSKSIAPTVTVIGGS